VDAVSLDTDSGLAIVSITPLAIAGRWNRIDSLAAMKLAEVSPRHIASKYVDRGMNIFLTPTAEL
jgi:hypothetical protein